MYGYGNRNKASQNLTKSKIPSNIMVSPPYFSRMMETSINRMRTGHTQLTHQYLMKKELPPVCVNCDTLLSIKHIVSKFRSFKTNKREAGV